MAHGHRHAARYPLARLWSEMDSTRRRVNHEIAHAATIDKAAQAAIHGGKKGHGLFQSVIKRLTGQ